MVGTLIFRVWGDRFLIADYEDDIEKLLESSPLARLKIACKVNIATEVASAPKIYYKKYQPHKIPKKLRPLNKQKFQS